MKSLTAFDPESILRCSRCGKCRSVCPVFAEIPSEPYVARGKVQLYKAMQNKVLKPTEKLRELLSFCLLCGQCAENCSNGVNTEEIVLRARSELVDQSGLPFIKRNAFQHFLHNNGRLTAAARLIYLYQRSGLSGLFKKISLLPEALKDKEKLLPAMAARPLRSQLPAVINPSGKVKGKVGYFTGCMSQYVFTETGKNVAKILARTGIQVYVPEQYCCGMPALTAGDVNSTVELARKNVAAFRETGVEVVVTDCATCGSALKNKYPHLLGEELPFQVYDISQFLVNNVDIKNLQPNRPNPAVVTYHDPCHLARHMKIKEEPRELLMSIPGIEYVELYDAHRCCGASGSFQLEHRRLAAQIGAHKAKNIQNTGARVVAAGCPSCRMQLERVLETAGCSGMQVVHPVDLLVH
jgi:glycolate oxidase iron-sulfur subunit